MHNIKQIRKEHDFLLKKLSNRNTNISLNNIIDLDEIFNLFQVTMKNFNSELAFANSRSRLRMLTLYQIAQSKNALVVGTGNKVEDFGIGYYTKYVDGGVDI